MADTTVVTNASGRIDFNMGMWGPYWSDISTGVIIFITFVDPAIDLRFARTTDKGATWAATEMNPGTMVNVSVWYDKETPGDNGTLVHCLYFDRAGTDTAFYRTVDVSDGSLGTERTVDAGITPSSSDFLTSSSITKTVGGNLLVAFETITEIECYRSTDSGENWTSRADVYEAANVKDWLHLYPADTADNQDAVGIFGDRSAGDLEIKMYDDSANSWTPTSIDTDIVTYVSRLVYDGVVRHSDKHILVIAHSDQDTSGDDLRCFDLTVDSIASPTVTAKTNIFTNQAESSGVGLWINQNNDEVRLIYIKGNPTWESTADAVFHISDDGMATWGSEQAYSEATADDIRRAQAGRSVGNTGGRYQPCFYNDDLLDIFVNLVNDAEIAAAAGEAQPFPNESPGAFSRRLLTLAYLMADD